MKNINCRAMRKICLLLLLSIYGIAHTQPRTDDFLKQLLTAGNQDKLKKVLDDPATYRVQIIYTQIDRDRRNRPSFHDYFFNVDPGLYFNPASTVKFPLAFLSLEKLHAINKPMVNLYTTMEFDSSYPGQIIRYEDSTAENERPSIAHFIKKAFLVSDNDAYNRMYQFVGQQEINENLHRKGYSTVRITRQFMGFTPEQNRHTNQIRFTGVDGMRIWTQPPVYNPDSIIFPANKILLGKAHYNRNDSLVNEPIDFTMANYISLFDLKELLRSVLFPDAVPAHQRFKLTDKDYHFLYQYLSQYPRETSYPFYDTTKYFDSCVKLYFRDSTQRMPAYIRVFNKVGWAYGFLTDISYVADFKNKIEFMLTTTVYVNSDGILNDDRYDYDSIGYPFLYQLGQTIYAHELQRVRKFKPDLSRFLIQYEHRDPADRRKPISEVDN